MIEAKNLYYKYENNFVLEGVNLSISGNAVTAIIGHNGSGKTTLAKHFNGLLLPSKGSVVVDGTDSKNQKGVRKLVGFIFQNFEDQLIHSIVEEDIAFGLENLGLESGDIDIKTGEILKKLQITHLARANVNSLSMGQKQLVALAGVLAMQPKYIVFDEPTTMLDSKNKRLIMKLIVDLKKETTPILVTNNIDEIKYADDIIVLKKGKILFQGKRKSLSKAILKRAGLYE